MTGQSGNGMIALKNQLGMNAHQNFESLIEATHKIPCKRILALSDFEEAVGVLHDLDNDISTAVIGPCNIRVPSELIVALEPYIGKRVAILRTDDQLRPYRWRLLD